MGKRKPKLKSFSLDPENIRAWAKVCSIPYADAELLLRHSNAAVNLIMEYKKSTEKQAVEAFNRYPQYVQEISAFLWKEDTSWMSAENWSE
jgi:hypothetical protein